MDRPSLSPEHLPVVVKGLRRWLYVCLGLLFVFLAALGALLPILPTTPFLLLASFFFVRSSPALQAWLMRSPLFGPFLRDWQKHHAVRPRAKVAAYILIPTAIGSSAILGQLSWPLIVLLCSLGLIGLVVVWRLAVIVEPGPLEPVELCTSSERV